MRRLAFFGSLLLLGGVNLAVAHAATNASPDELPFRKAELKALGRTHAAFTKELRRLAPAYYEHAEKFTTPDGRKLAQVGKPKWSGKKIGLDPQGTLFEVLDFESELTKKRVQETRAIKPDFAWAVVGDLFPGGKYASLPRIVSYLERAVPGTKTRAGYERVRRLQRAQGAASRRRHDDDALRQTLVYYKVDPERALANGVDERIASRGEVVLAETDPYKLGSLGPGTYIDYKQTSAKNAQLVLKSSGQMVLMFDQTNGQRTRYPFDLTVYDIGKLFPRLDIKTAIESALR
jgi:hypothetical protein